MFGLCLETSFAGFVCDKERKIGVRVKEAGVMRLAACMKFGSLCKREQICSELIQNQSIGE
jgi:hypothetical protein